MLGAMRERSSGWRWRAGLLVAAGLGCWAAACSSGAGHEPPGGGACAGAADTPGGSDGQGGCWPGPGNTGVPVGITLARYEGPCTLTIENSPASVVIDGKDATGCGILAVRDVAVEIRDSVVPVIDRTVGDGRVVIHDSVAQGEGWSGGVLWGSNIDATRVEVTGGQHSVHCEGHCTVSDSWLHGQEAPAGVATHNNAFISNGGTAMVLRHDTLHCSAEENADGGGCTADASLFGDFDTISDVTVDGNLFVATPSGGYCGTFGHNPQKPYGEAPTGVVVTGNVFQRGASGRCGVYGPVTSFLEGHGNVWSANRYTDGEAITPSGSRAPAAGSRSRARPSPPAPAPDRGRPAPR